VVLQDLWLANNSLGCEIRAFHGGGYKIGCLLSCCAVWSGIILPTTVFIMRMIALMMEAASTLEMPLNFYQTTRCNNLEDSQLQLSRFAVHDFAYEATLTIAFRAKIFLRRDFRLCDNTHLEGKCLKMHFNFVFKQNENLTYFH
jgi:hypothetical protein